MESLKKEGIHLSVHKVKKDEIKEIKNSFKEYRLHEGDISIIVVALKLKSLLVLTDDLELRKAITNIQLKTVGTVGIIIKAWKEGIISKQEVAEIIEDLFEKSTLYLSKGFKKYITQLLIDTHLLPS